MNNLHIEIQDQFKKSAEVKLRTAETQWQNIEKAINLIVKSIEEGGKVLVCGNGGSAADSQHIAAEFIGRFLINRKALPAIALTTDTSILTAVANDFSYDQVFTRQVEALGKTGDVIIGISTSGKSPNVYNAAVYAKKRGMKVIILAGQEFTPMCREADAAVNVESVETPRIQEAHITIAHIICDFVERYFAKL